MSGAVIFVMTCGGGDVCVDHYLLKPYGLDYLRPSPSSW